jgi:putative membrane protein
LLGFVTGSKDVPAGTFEIARFYISCCIADAQAVGVPIVGPQPKPDTWLAVTGSLARRGKRFVVEPSKIERVDEPAQPYLSFRT